MTKGIILDHSGGAELLKLRDITVPQPAPGQALIRHTAIGLNYIDVYHRTGLYPVSFPSSIGLEAAGIVEALGDGVDDLKVGQRVAYAGGPLGAYVEARVMPADRLVPIPDAISDQQAASMMLQGMTVQYLFHRTYPLKADDTILFHAAAGGVGLIACQWAKAMGVTLIGTVSSPAKAELALSHGAAAVIDYSREDFVARVKDLTGGKGVAVVYDSVGKDTFDKSLDCLRPRGMMVIFGQSSGKIPPFDTGILSAKGSLFLTRPTLFSYIASREELLATAGDLFDRVVTGDIVPQIGQTYRLADAERAHRDLEERKTIGSTVLLVD